MNAHEVNRGDFGVRSERGEQCNGSGRMDRQEGNRQGWSGGLVKL